MIIAIIVFCCIGIVIMIPVILGLGVLIIAAGMLSILFATLSVCYVIRFCLTYTEKVHDGICPNCNGTEILIVPDKDKDSNRQKAVCGCCDYVWEYKTEETLKEKRKGYLIDLAIFVVLYFVSRFIYVLFR